MQEGCGHWLCICHTKVFDWYRIVCGLCATCPTLPLEWSVAVALISVNVLSNNRDRVYCTLTTTAAAFDIVSVWILDTSNVSVVESPIVEMLYCHCRVCMYPCTDGWDTEWLK